WRYIECSVSTVGSRVNEQIDFFGEQVGHFADHVSAQNIDERITSRCAQDESRSPERGGYVDDGFGGGFADGITEKWRMIAGFFFCGGENFGGFRVFLPFAFAVLLGHEALLAHKEKIKPASGLARFAQGEVQRAAGAANGAKNRFGAREF